MSQSSSPDDRVELRGILANLFSEDELRTLCFDLNVDYDSLPGEAVGGNARELVSHFERRGDLARLKARVQKERPAAFRTTASRNEQHRVIGSESHDTVVREPESRDGVGSEGTAGANYCSISIHGGINNNMGRIVFGDEVTTLALLFDQFDVRAARLPSDQQVKAKSMVEQVINQIKRIQHGDRTDRAMFDLHIALRKLKEINGDLAIHVLASLADPGSAVASEIKEVARDMQEQR